jgi:hypothetical protein
MDQWLYSISDHCFDDLTNYRKNCHSSIVNGIVFASDVKRCTLSYFASVSSSETMDRWGWQYGNKRLGMVYLYLSNINIRHKLRLNQSPDLRMQTCCYMYPLGIQCKRQNIPDHAFYSYSVLNHSLPYICNISFLEVHLERVANSIWLARTCCVQ